MAKPPLSGQEQTKVGSFVGQLLRGVADLGFTALPYVALYQRAREQKLTIIDLALEDEETVRTVVEALKRKAARLPLPILHLMEQVIVAARVQASPATAPVQAMSDHDAP